MPQNIKIDAKKEQDRQLHQQVQESAAMQDLHQYIQKAAESLGLDVDFRVSVTLKTTKVE